MGCIKKPDVVIRGDKLESWHKHADEGKQFDIKKKKNEKEKKNFNSKETSWHSNTTKKKEEELSR